MVHGQSNAGMCLDPEEGIMNAYQSGVTDEFILPFICSAAQNSRIRDEDSCIFFNFRADRARQITRALVQRSGLTPELKSSTSGLDATIPPSSVPNSLRFVCMAQYDQRFQLPVVVPSKTVSNILSDVFEREGFRNLRIAETEKYAHVTYFFNGGSEQPFPGEERILIQSPNVATYDLSPEMSASSVTAATVKAINDGSFDVVIVNFANADMVGHSGKLEPTINAIEVLDSCLGEIEKSTVARGGALLVTADHGNAEMMIDPTTQEPHTAHTTNPVPFIAVTSSAERFSLRNGSLADIGPTMLDLLAVDQPHEMTGHSLIEWP
jgi:2,3-bisphosphoglycerate-independent phosphoglycerate mutase